MGINKDQIKGTVKDVAGKAQEKFGDATDDPKHQTEGTGRQAEGKTQKTVGDVKDAVDNLRNK